MGAERKRRMFDLLGKWLQGDELAFLPLLQTDFGDFVRELIEGDLVPKRMSLSKC
jgi:hypothetical protein